jgi:hypothetical protein
MFFCEHLTDRESTTDGIPVFDRSARTAEEESFGQHRRMMEDAR